MKNNIQPGKVAEAFALYFLENEFDNDMFIGSYIEQILDDRVKLIYQYVEDENFYGAAITDSNGDEYIVLNSYHPLRTRYFTAAHELWHLSEGSKQMPNENFDHERAADRFAAAIMMPRGLTKALWSKFKKNYDSQEEAVIHLADISSMPYVATVRRLKEVARITGLDELNEAAWVEKRKALNITDSILDKPQIIEKFDAYVKEVEILVNDGEIDKLSAANKVGRYNPELAEKWQKEAMKRYE